MDDKKKLKWDSHYFQLNWLKDFYNNNKNNISKTMQDVLADAIDCMEYVISETETKTEIKKEKETEIENNPYTVKVGDIIYGYNPISEETTNYEIEKISITKVGTLLKDIYGETICPLSFVDANKPWGFKGLYFSSDKKRQEYIDNNK